MAVPVPDRRLAAMDHAGPGPRAHRPPGAAGAAAAVNADRAHDDGAPDPAAHHGDGAEDWDRRYAGGDLRWSGRPNPTLVAELDGAVAGNALDVGCGEGADAIWLARRGWKVTGLDISQVALDRARLAAGEAGVEIEWRRADVADAPPEPGAYDLVSAHYPALRRTPDGGAVRALIDAVAPGGTLLVVGHALDGGDDHRGHGFDPADYVQPDDVARHLDDAWTIEVHETRPRTRPAGSGPDVPDVVLRARRA